MAICLLVATVGVFHGRWMCMAVDRGEPERGGADRRRLAAAAVVGLVLNAGAFLVKAHAFPDSTPSRTTSRATPGDTSLADSSASAPGPPLTNWSIAPVMIGSLALAFFDLRYLTGTVLLAPLLLLHMLSIRPEHGAFSLGERALAEVWMR